MFLFCSHCESFISISELKLDFKSTFHGLLCSIGNIALGVRSSSPTILAFHQSHWLAQRPGLELLAGIQVTETFHNIAPLGFGDDAPIGGHPIGFLWFQLVSRHSDEPVLGQVV